MKRNLRKGAYTMLPVKEQYIIDENGQRVSVVLEIGAYQKLLEELEELESIRAYDQAKSRDDEAVPFEQAVEACRFG